MTIRVTVDVFLEDGATPNAIESRILAAVGGDNPGTVSEEFHDQNRQDRDLIKEGAEQYEPVDPGPRGEKVGSVGVKVKPSSEDSEPEVNHEEDHDGVPSPPKAEEAPKRRKRRTKAEIAADKAAEEEAKRAAEAEADEDTDDRPGDDKEDEENGEDYAALRVKARKLAGKFLSENGREALQELLEPYEATKITGVPDEKLGEFIDALEL